MTTKEPPFWTLKIELVLQALRTSVEGLSSEEAQNRLVTYGKNWVRDKSKRKTFDLLIAQFTSPLILILLATAILSAFFKDPVNTYLIVTIVVLSGLISFIQEKKAFDAVKELLKLVETTACVAREGKIQKIPLYDIVPGDIVHLDAGDIIPADCLLIEEKDLFVNESTFSGEAFAAEKKAGPVEENLPLLKRANTLFMGSYVISGKAIAVVTTTGKNTAFGNIAEALKTKQPVTAFEAGIKKFSYFLMKVTLSLIGAIFLINLYFERPLIDSFLFALALSVGLTPQLLPAIISVNLAQGARRMSKSFVIVKKLSAIENFGSMQVLCCDKTGTMTKGVIELYSAMGLDGKESEKCHTYAFYNAFFQTGFTNTIDDAIKEYKSYDTIRCKKLDEIPYDFSRKRLSILCENEKETLLITKGAFKEILSLSTHAEEADGRIVDITPLKKQIEERFEEWSLKGFRILALSYKKMTASLLTKADETEMIFLGLLLFFDPPKEDIRQVLDHLQKIGVRLVMITGDNPLIAKHIAEKVGIASSTTLTGSELSTLEPKALVDRCLNCSIFAEIEPFQKQTILKQFKAAGKIVGFLGDGINDSIAMHTADVGICVESAADVLKDVADIVLLKKSLKSLIQGVLEGRRTFANTLKYVFMATSANFGNMFSVAGASLFLPFLPLLPKQILLTNLITDLPEMAIASDNVDKELIERPWRWDISFIRKFMLIFGPISSVFDFLTFVVLLHLKVNVEHFRTGWLLESILSASLITLFIRTRKSIFSSRPSKLLLFCVLLVCSGSLFLPYVPKLSPLFELRPLPLELYGAIGLILVGYMISVEIAKALFYKRIKL